MKLDTFIAINRANAIIVPLKEIILTSNVHTKDIEKDKTITGEINDDSIIIVTPLRSPRREDNAKYTLVSGWKTFMIAQNQNVENIKAIVVPYKSYKFKHYLNKKAVGVIDFNVITPPSERVTKPNPVKMEWIRNQCLLLGGHTIDSPVTIKIGKDGVVKLIDGYIRYWVAKELGITMLPFTIAKN